MSDEAEHLRQELWKGSIPAVFTLANESVSAPSPPRPYYLMLSRHSYIPLSADDAVDFFSPFAPVMEGGGIWFEHAGVPLKWHVPVGVLFDMHGSSDDLPWAITVHFGGFPSQKLLHCKDKVVVEKHFMNSMKQAMFMKYGSARIMNELAKEHQDQLWEGVRSVNLGLYWQVNRRLLERGQQARHVALRVLLPSAPPLQHLFTPLDPNTGRERQLGAVLLLLLPHLFHRSSSSSSSSTSDCKQVRQQQEEEMLGEEGVVANEGVEVKVQGVTPPLSSPLLGWAASLAHPDHFLYVVVRTRQPHLQPQPQPPRSSSSSNNNSSSSSSSSNNSSNSVTNVVQRSAATAAAAAVGSHDDSGDGDRDAAAAAGVVCVNDSTRNSSGGGGVSNSSDRGGGGTDAGIASAATTTAETREVGEVRPPPPPVVPQ